MEVEHRDLEPFEPTLRRLLGIAFDPPRVTPKSAELIARFAPSDGDRRAVAETLSAYGRLQEAAAAEVIRLEEESRALNVQMKAARRAKDRVARDLERKIEILRRRQLIVRRMMDSIVYFACGQYVVFIRRLALHDDVRPIDPGSLAHIVDIAQRLNLQEPRSVYLAADLTTSVQIGDLVQITAEPNSQWSLRILEVKEGKINRILANKLGGGRSPEELRKEIGNSAARQAVRILRQQRRLHGFSDFVHAGRGLDPRTNRDIRRTPDKTPVPGSQPELRALLEKAERDGQAIMKVNDCLVLGAVRADALPEPRLSLAAHCFFHYNRPEVACLLSTPRAQEELILLKNEPIVDLVENSYRATWGFPVVAWGNLDEVCNLLTGRTRVYAMLDFDAFMKRAERLGLTMKWVTGRRGEMLKRTGGTDWIPGGPRGSAIRVEMKGTKPFELLSGFIARIFLELAKPDTLLKGLVDTGPDLRKVQNEVILGEAP